MGGLQGVLILIWKKNTDCGPGVNGPGRSTPKTGVTDC